MHNRKVMAILGSRSLDDERVIKMVLSYIRKEKPSHLITSGECHGVSAVGRAVAKKLPIPIILHFLNPNDGQGKYDQRNKAMIEETDVALLIHDGVSIGTMNELELCKKNKVKYYYEKLEVKEIEAIDLDILDMEDEL